MKKLLCWFSPKIMLYNHLSSNNSIRIFKLVKMVEKWEKSFFLPNSWSISWFWSIIFFRKIMPNNPIKTKLVKKVTFDCFVSSRGYNSIDARVSHDLFRHFLLFDLFWPQKWPKRSFSLSFLKSEQNSDLNDRSHDLFQPFSIFWPCLTSRDPIWSFSLSILNSD